MLAQLLTEKNTRAWIQAEDWKAAGHAAGDLLIAGGAVEPAYIEKMITHVEELGPYIVVVPGIALFHSKGDEDVHKVGLSLVTVKDGVNFNAGRKDPVRLIFAFASPDKTQHLEMLHEIMCIIKRPDLVEEIIKAPAAKDIVAIIQKNFD
jgi:mannitol/fructose-specific phosphotransferase system IIA component (Ntr-type)